MLVHKISLNKCLRIEFIQNVFFDNDTIKREVNNVKITKISLLTLKLRSAFLNDP